MIEQVFAGDSAISEIRAMLLQAEAARDDVAVWFDVVVADNAQGRRPIFVTRYGKRVTGYMILKPKDHKISSIFVEVGQRGKGIAEAMYGVAVVNLCTPQPYTAFVPEMVGEFSRLIRSHNLVLDDTGPLFVLNPGDGHAETWAEIPRSPARAALPLRSALRR
ncbi:MAG: hypothetical protein SFV21_15975 [Rhodospirillaceae bacterium]|nr:hypothetical protein [Rhodospirillaceae bacterium]